VGHLQFLKSGTNRGLCHRKVLCRLPIVGFEDGSFVQFLPGIVDFSLRTLAGISGLSQSRFMHVFTESMGVPLRPYVLWLRLQRACCDLMGGASVTTAAHNAGFSDAAHLTRTFRRMLGMTPTDLALRKRMSRGVTMDRVDSHRERINPTPTVRVVAATRTAPV
jgi:AraC-like DNA-binding protein